MNNIKENISGVRLGILVVLIVFTAVPTYLWYKGQKKEMPVNAMQTHRAIGEYLVLSNKGVAAVVGQLDVKSGSELIRREVSRLAIGTGSLNDLDKGIEKFREEAGSEVELVKLGRGIRLAQILYEAGQTGEAKVVLGILSGKAVNSYSEGLKEVKEIVASKDQERFKVRVEQLEEVLAVVAINRVLELNLPVGDLVKDMVNSVKWDNLGDGTEIGKIYLLQLIGVYAGQDYYTSGLYAKLKSYWGRQKDKDFMSKPRIVEASAMFKSLDGQKLD